MLGLTGLIKPGPPDGQMPFSPTNQLYKDIGGATPVTDPSQTQGFDFARNLSAAVAANKTVDGNGYFTIFQVQAIAFGPNNSGDGKPVWRVTQPAHPTNPVFHINSSSGVIPATVLSGEQILPLSTITVSSTAGFPQQGWLNIAGSTGNVAYTGITSTTFTGCTGGNGDCANLAVVTGVPHPIDWTTDDGTGTYRGSGQLASPGLSTGSTYSSIALDSNGLQPGASISGTGIAFLVVSPDGQHCDQYLSTGAAADGATSIGCKPVTWLTGTPQTFSGSPNQPPGGVLNVVSTAGWPSSGSISINTIGTVTYTGKTSTSFTGVQGGSAGTPTTWVQVSGVSGTNVQPSFSFPTGSYVATHNLLGFWNQFFMQQVPVPLGADLSTAFLEYYSDRTQMQSGGTDNQMTIWDTQALDGNGNPRGALYEMFHFTALNLRGTLSNTAPLSTSGATTSLSVNALAHDLPAGKWALRSVDGVNVDTFVTTSNTTAGSTTISITSHTFNYSYSVGATIGSPGNMGEISTSLTTGAGTTSVAVNGTLNDSGSTTNGGLPIDLYAILDPTAGNIDTFTTTAFPSAGSVTIASKQFNFAYIAAAAGNASIATAQIVATTGGSSLSTTAATSSITVSALAAALKPGQYVLQTTSGDPTTTEVFTVKTAASAGATSLTIEPHTFKFPFPSGSRILKISNTFQAFTNNAVCRPPTGYPLPADGWYYVFSNSDYVGPKHPATPGVGAADLTTMFTGRLPYFAKLQDQTVGQVSWGSSACDLLHEGGKVFMSDLERGSIDHALHGWTYIGGPDLDPTNNKTGPDGVADGVGAGGVTGIQGMPVTRWDATGWNGGQNNGFRVGPFITGYIDSGGTSHTNSDIPASTTIHGVLVDSTSWPTGTTQKIPSGTSLRLQQAAGKTINMTSNADANPGDSSISVSSKSVGSNAYPSTPVKAVTTSATGTGAVTAILVASGATALGNGGSPPNANGSITDPTGVRNDSFTITNNTGDTSITISSHTFNFNYPVGSLITVRGTGMSNSPPSQVVYATWIYQHPEGCWFRLDPAWIMPTLYDTFATVGGGPLSLKYPDLLAASSTITSTRNAFIEPIHLMVWSCLQRKGMFITDGSTIHEYSVDDTVHHGTRYSKRTLPDFNSIIQKIAPNASVLQEPPNGTFGLIRYVAGTDYTNTIATLPLNPNVTGPYLPGPAGRFSDARADANTTLSGGQQWIGGATSSITVTSTTGFPSKGYLIIAGAPGLIYYGSKDSTHFLNVWTNVSAAPATNAAVQLGYLPVQQVEWGTW